MCFLAYIPPQKICFHCKTPHGWEAFSSDSRTPDGMRYLCRDCVSIKNKAGYARNQAKRVADARQRRQAAPPGLIAAQSKARYHADTARHLAHKHKQYWKDPEKMRARQRAQYAKHRAKRRLTMRTRYATNPEKWVEWRADHLETIRLIAARRRARKQALPDTFTLADRAFMLQHWQHACAVCGNEEGFFWTLAQDHWIPVSHPTCPGTVAYNIVPLCHTKKGGQGGCNNSKNKAEPLPWLTAQLGPRRAKAIMRKVEAYFALVRTRQNEAS
jgi:hypothetical protein